MGLKFFLRKLRFFLGGGVSWQDKVNVDAINDLSMGLEDLRVRLVLLKGKIDKGLRDLNYRLKVSDDNIGILSERALGVLEDLNSRINRLEGRKGDDDGDVKGEEE